MENGSEKEESTNMKESIQGRQTTDQFQRLVKSHTISSLARRIATKLPQTSVPPDSLDLALASTYDHHSVWGAARAYVVKQERACTVDHASEFKRKLFGEGEDRDDLRKYKESREPYRNDAYHVQQGITPYHGANSRRGFGRSADGSFYST